MKMKELREYLNALYEMDERNDELSLAVIINSPSVGARSHVLVKSVTQGFDWEHGKLMIYVNETIRKESIEF